LSLANIDLLAIMELTDPRVLEAGASFHGKKPITVGI
jgi:hypothetical protein